MTDEKVQLTRVQMERLNEQAAVQAAAEPKPQEPKKVYRQVDASRIRQAEFLRQDWVCTAEFGTTIDEVRDEGYFAHKASEFKPYDEITVRVDDGTWMAKLMVLECGRNWARTYMMAFYKLTTSDVSRTMSLPKLKVDFKGPHLKFCVIRIADNQILQDKMDSEEQARAWIVNRENKQ